MHGWTGLPRSAINHAPGKHWTHHAADARSNESKKAANHHGIAASAQPGSWVVACKSNDCSSACANDEADERGVMRNAHRSDPGAGVGDRLERYRPSMGAGQFVVGDLLEMALHREPVMADLYGDL